MKIQILRFIALLSQFLNVLLGGHHDQTFSSRVYVNRKKELWEDAYKIINLIFFWQGDHCKSSFEADVKYAKQILKIKKREK